MLIKKLPLILLFTIIIQIVFVLYLNRSIFIDSYDVQYWKDRFEHSQWQLPLSKRAIGDDALYSYIGYELTNGLDPSSINAEAPPAGKYLLGLSIKYFGHYIWYTIFAGILSLILVYLITKIITKNSLSSLLAVLLLVFDPLFFSQFTASLLEQTQLLFILLSVYFMLIVIKVSNRFSLIFAIVSGVSFGIAVQVKAPILIPLICILYTIYFIRNKKYYPYIMYLIGCIIGYLLPYIPYFLSGNTLSDFVNIIKYMLGFYRRSRLETNYFALLQTLFIGRFPHITSGQIIFVSEFILFWPLSIVLFLFALIKKSSTLSIEHKGISIYIIFSILLFSLIPAYPRYLLIIVPFLYIVISQQVVLLSKKKLLIVICLLSIYGFSNTYYFNYNLAQSSINSYIYNFSNQFFQDVYQESINKEYIQSISRNDFRNEIQSDFNDAQIRYITLKEIHRTVPLFGNRGTVLVDQTYYTQHLGSFTERKDIPLVKINGKWFIDWNWDLVIEKYHPDYTFKSDIQRGKRGAILSKSGSVLSEDINGYMFCVRPDMLENNFQEQEMLQHLQDLTLVSAIAIQNAYLENTLPDSYILIGSNIRNIASDELAILDGYLGLVLKPYTTRIMNGIGGDAIINTKYNECCTHLYSATNYHGFGSYERDYEFEIKGQDGGSLKLLNDNNEVIRVILKQDPIVGKDVVI